MNSGVRGAGVSVTLGVLVPLSLEGILRRTLISMTAVLQAPRSASVEIKPPSTSYGEGLLVKNGSAQLGVF